MAAVIISDVHLQLSQFSEVQWAKTWNCHLLRSSDGRKPRTFTISWVTAEAAAKLPSTPLWARLRSKRGARLAWAKTSINLNCQHCRMFDDRKLRTVTISKPMPDKIELRLSSGICWVKTL